MAITIAGGSAGTSTLTGISGGAEFDGTVTATSVTASGVVGTAATGALKIPVGTTAQRPGSPASGMIRQNSTTGSPEWYDSVGAQWILFSLGAPYSLEYLVIAGGGSGGGNSADGNQRGGGGGAGGYRSSVSGESSGGGAPAESALSVNSSYGYSITVGAGAATVSGDTRASGSDSVFSSVTSVGGGGGGAMGAAALSGGSGGGGAADPTTAGSGTASQGFAGTTGGGYSLPSGSGGGAASTGGTGVASSITGSSVTRAAGGAGINAAGSGAAGTVNCGNGGGGACGGTGGAGGSGVVILRYLGAQRGTGGTVTSSGGYTIHTFNSSGTYTA